VVLDNEVFASTGGQMTYARTVSLDGLAKSSGYPLVERVDRLDPIQGIWRQALDRKGPAFILLKCQQDAGPPMERVRFTPEEITSRFKEAAHATTQG
jgi:TPP-dependent indolepyruvate ferredoxin oxidoreductase alpha subunit